ncbi:hypothetical protein [Gulosibacter bifidus]|uniref:Uncharacterized protein n=1 Tax=Gulosibacter bifidus TaxID=272239 RepID=A0ABW5RKL9_9MICO|nr:hypothetical protein [Gulosibacter bifidus]
MKERSLELQREILDVMPPEAIKGNSLPGPGELEFTLLECEPIFSNENDSNAGQQAVQYPGTFAVELNDEAQGSDIANAILADTLESLPELSPVNEGDSPGLGVNLSTSDGFIISIDTVRPKGSKSAVVQVDVWSPCFYPSEGTLPPGSQV